MNHLRQTSYYGNSPKSELVRNLSEIKSILPYHKTYTSNQKLLERKKRELNVFPSMHHNNNNNKGKYRS